MRNVSLIIGSTCVLTLALACGGSGQSANAPHPTDQVAWGQQLYGDHCSGCHGDQGQGKAAPAVVGKDALPLDPPATAKFRKVQFHTAKDVLDWTKANMPPGKSGSVSQEECEAIIAFDLKANGVDLGGKHVDGSTAASFVLHP